MNCKKKSNYKNNIHLIVVTVFLLVYTANNFAQNQIELPKEKQTTLGLYVTSEEAYEMWKASPEKIKILDVRTQEEYIFVGHADMAWNIPVFSQTYKWDAENKHFPMKPNTDFISQVQKIASPMDTILVTCRSGGRSAMAVNYLADAGFKNVFNITDGFEGGIVKNPESVFHGQRMINGWKNYELPWTYEIIPEKMLLSDNK